MSNDLIRVGFGVTDTVANAIILSAAPTTTGNYMSFEYPSGTDYAVTAGKTLIICRLMLCGTVNDKFSLGYGDNGKADGADAPTNAVIIVPASWTLGTVNVMNYIDCMIKIPAGKYPYIRHNGAGASTINATALCLEV